MKILFLYSHLTVRSGGSRYILEIVDKLSQNHEVTLYVQKASDEMKKIFSDRNINIKTLGKYSTDDLIFWIQFKKLIRNQIHFLERESKNYDVVISSMFPMNIIANSLNIPHIQNCFQPYAFFWDSIMIKKLPFFKKILLNFCKKFYGKSDIEATQNADYVFTVISGVQKWIKKIYNCDSIVIHPGVDTNFFSKTHNENLRKQFHDNKIILHSTDWTPLKNTNWLIDQFLKINREIPSCKLLIMEVKTSGHEKNIALKKIKKLNIQNIEFLGFIPENMLSSYYSLADLVVYVGIGEGASSASYIVLEAMSCETPVIRINESSTEIIHGKNGLIFEKNNSEQFLKNLLMLLKNEKLSNELGKNAREFIKNERTWNNTLNHYEKYLNLIKEKNLNTS